MVKVMDLEDAPDRVSASKNLYANIDHLGHRTRSKFVIADEGRLPVELRAAAQRWILRHAAAVLFAGRRADVRVTAGRLDAA